MNVSDLIDDFVANYKESWFAGFMEDDSWNCGPYETPAGAAIAFIEREGLQSGDTFTVGCLDKHKPHLHVESVLDWLVEDERIATEWADTWLRGLTQNEKDRLGFLLDKAVMDWLEEIDRVPAFGTITDMRECFVGEDQTPHWLIEIESKF